MRDRVRSWTHYLLLLQTHFVIHVCLFVKFHSVLFDLSNSGVWPDQPVQDRVRHTQLWRLICQKVENEKNRSCGRERKKHLKVQQFSTEPSISFFLPKKIKVIEDKK